LKAAAEKAAADFGDSGGPATKVRREGSGEGGIWDGKPMVAAFGSPMARDECGLQAAVRFL
jgi:hypothetical protein